MRWGHTFFAMCSLNLYGICLFVGLRIAITIGQLVCGCSIRKPLLINSFVKTACATGLSSLTLWWTSPPIHKTCGWSHYNSGTTHWLTSLIRVLGFNIVFKLRLTIVSGGGVAWSLATPTEDNPSAVHSNLHQLILWPQSSEESIYMNMYTHKPI